MIDVELHSVVVVVVVGVYEVGVKRFVRRVVVALNVDSIKWETVCSRYPSVVVTRWHAHVRQRVYRECGCCCDEQHGCFVFWRWLSSPWFLASMEYMRVQRFNNRGKYESHWVKKEKKFNK
jgi:hypothetical protein